MDELLDTARRAALGAGELLLDRFGKKHQLTYKGDTDFATEADFAAERIILDIIRSAHPDHSILAEESGQHESSGDVLWVVDPLDGTTNFAHGYPFFCTSICAVIDGKPTVGVIYDPMRKELFEAVAGGGAFLNGKQISVSPIDLPVQALVCTGFVYDRGPALRTPLQMFEKVINEVQAVRRDGSAALDLAYTACGRFDAFYEINLNAWDVAAGVLLVLEAGGGISKVDGSPCTIFDRDLLATNARLHKPILDILRS
jgi:myo-inositol-1(or 4)-monophosphatase